MFQFIRQLGVQVLWLLRVVAFISALQVLIYSPASVRVSIVMLPHERGLRS
jgi:hypothetical protein